MFGHTLAKTHIYKAKYTSLRTYWLTDLSCVCPQSLCLILDSPEPWFGPVVCMKILSSCSYPPGQWLQLWTWVDPWLSFFPSLWLVVFPLLPWEEQVQCCHHVSYTNKQYSCWLLLASGKAFYCCARAGTRIGAVVLWGAPYIGWVQMCMGLAMAGACAKHRPCYWSQTKCIDCVWKFHAFCIPFNDNSLNFEKEIFDHLELQDFFTCCMEKWFSYLITCNLQIYLNNRYCCVCFSFVIKIEWEGYQVQWCYTELSIYQSSPVTDMEGKEAAHATCSPINFIKMAIHVLSPGRKWTLLMKLSAIQCNQSIL